jgi:predicted dehydrogenase
MRALIVGLGGRGYFWWEECQRHPEVEVAGCVEPQESVREWAVREAKIPEERIFSDFRTAVDAIEVDFVLDVTPPSVHERIADLAFEAHLPLLGEKPISDNLAAAQRMVQAGQHAGVVHMITQNYRFNQLPRTTRRLLDKEIIGEIGQLDVSLYVPWADKPGSHYVTEPYMFLTDMGIHHFDMMRYLLACEPVSVLAKTWNQSWGWHQGDACQFLCFQFEDGIMATHRGSGCTIGHVPANHNGEWRFEGSTGSLTWEGAELFLTRHHRVEPKVREMIELDRSAEEGINPLLSEFVTAVGENRQPECNAIDNLKSFGMVMAARCSAEEGREVSLEEALSS